MSSYGASELRYTPNPSAKSLRTRRSDHIGVLVPTLTDVVLATIYEGIEKAAERHGYSTSVTNSLDDAARRERQTATMLARHPDAMIFGDADFHSYFLERQRRKGVHLRDSFRAACRSTRSSPPTISLPSVRWARFATLGSWPASM